MSIIPQRAVGNSESQFWSIKGIALIAFGRARQELYFTLSLSLKLAVFHSTPYYSTKKKELTLKFQDMLRRVLGDNFSKSNFTCTDLTMVHSIIVHLNNSDKNLYIYLKFSGYTSYVT